MDNLSPDALAYTIPELAQALRVSVPYVYKLINAGELRSFARGRRRLVSRSAALEFIEQAEAETVLPADSRYGRQREAG